MFDFTGDQINENGGDIFAYPISKDDKIFWFFALRRFPGLSVPFLHLHFVFQFLLLLLFDQ